MQWMCLWIIINLLSLSHTRFPCPQLSPAVYSNSCSLGRWCHPTVSFSVVPFSSCLLSFSASGSFQMSQLFVSGDRSIGASALASVLLMNIQGWLISFRIDRFDLLAIKGALKRLLQHHSSKASILRCLVFLYGPTLTFIHDYWKSHSFDYTDLCQQSDVSAF